MPYRLVIATFAFVSIGFAQSLPSYQWIKELDASGMDSVAGLGTDAAGNTYIAGTTSSSAFPVKNALQSTIASSGLYSIFGGSTTQLGLSSATSIAIATQAVVSPGATFSPAVSVIYAVSNGVLMSKVGNAAFAPTSLPDSNVSAVATAVELGGLQVVFAATYDQGVFRSVDGGMTWTTANNGLPVLNTGAISVSRLWIDPYNMSLIFARTTNGLARSVDAGLDPLADQTSHRGPSRVPGQVPHDVGVCTEAGVGPPVAAGVS